MILIIDKNKKCRDSIRDIFYYMGILSMSVSPKEAFTEVSPKYRAVLISNPEDMSDMYDYVSRLRAYSGNIPIFSISRETFSKSFTELFDRCYPENIYSSRLAADMVEYSEKRGLPSLGKYLLAGIDAGCDLTEVRHLSAKLDLTKTETMILRYLIVSYPTPKLPKDIIRFSFKPTRLPEAAGIRTHISVINKKFHKLRGRYLIESLPKEGYVIITPENRQQ